MRSEHAEAKQVRSVHGGIFTVKVLWGISCVNKTACLVDFPRGMNKNENTF